MSEGEQDEPTADLCLFLCPDRRGLPSGPARPGRGEAVQRGAAAERGEEHPEERRQPANGSAAAALGQNTRRQKAKVRICTECKVFFIKQTNILNVRTALE